MDLLSESAGFSGGCGDFGCAPGSVALPVLLEEPKPVGMLVTLAARPGFFGQRALHALERMGSTLAKATCSSGWRPQSPEQLKEVLARLEAQRMALSAKGAQAERVRKALQRLEAALKRGVPEKACEPPGG